MHTAPMSQSGAPPSAQGLVDNPPVGRKGILSRAVGCHEHPLRHSNSVEQGQETGCVEVTRGRPCPPTHASTLSSGVLQDGSSRVLSLFEGRLDWMAGAAGPTKSPSFENISEFVGFGGAGRVSLVKDVQEGCRAREA